MQDIILYCLASKRQWPGHCKWYSMWITVQEGLSDAKPSLQNELDSCGEIMNHLFIFWMTRKWSGLNHRSEQPLNYPPWKREDDKGSRWLHFLYFVKSFVVLFCDGLKHTAHTHSWTQTTASNLHECCAGIFQSELEAVQANITDIIAGWIIIYLQIFWTHFNEL